MDAFKNWWTCLVGFFGTEPTGAWQWAPKAFSQIYVEKYLGEKVFLVECNVLVP